MRAHSLVYRMGTHETQRRPDDVAQEASEYMDLVRQFLEGPHRNRRFILNMDQTPVFFSMTAKRTLEVIGTRTVHIRVSPNDAKRAMVAVTIASDGTVLPSMIVFKGKADSRIAQSEFATYPPSHHY